MQLMAAERDRERERRLLYSYRCHRYKKMREPEEYSEEVYTYRIKTTCEICIDKQLERERECGNANEQIGIG